MITRRGLMLGAVGAAGAAVVPKVKASACGQFIAGSTRYWYVVDDGTVRYGEWTDDALWPSGDRIQAPRCAVA